MHTANSKCFATLTSLRSPLALAQLQTGAGDGVGKWGEAGWAAIRGNKAPGSPRPDPEQLHHITPAHLFVVMPAGSDNGVGDRREADRAALDSKQGGWQSQAVTSKAPSDLCYLTGVCSGVLLLI